MIGIYKITNKITGKSYIGQSINIEYRFKQHKSNALSVNNKDYNSDFYSDLRNLGEDNFQFDILEECEPIFLDEKEIYYIDYYDTYHNGYNRTCGGSGLNTSQVMEARRLWDEGYSNSQICEELKLCRETVRKYLLNYVNYDANESYKRGYWNSKINDFQNKKICQYTLNGDFIKSFFSCKEINRELGIWAQGVSRCLKGKYLSSGGFCWAYEGDELKPLTEEEKALISRGGLTQERVDLIKFLLSQGISRQEIGNQVNCSIKTVSRINQGERYNDNLPYPIYDYKLKKSNR